MVRDVLQLWLLALARPATAAEFALAKGGNLCAAGPTAAAYGPTTLIGLAEGKTCDDADDASTIPAEYIAVTLTAAAAINATDTTATSYLTDASLITEIEATGTTYFTAPNVSTATAGDGSTFSYGSFAFGTYLGNTSSTVFGYASQASYIGLSGTLSFTHNTFNVADADYSACIATDDADGASTACGSAQTAGAGTFKYSLMAYGDGSDFATWSAGYAFFGVRTVVDYAQMGATANVKFNGDNALSAMAGTQVSSITITGASGKALQYSFPQKFTYGSVDTGVPVKEGTASVKIRASSANATSFNIDYLFPWAGSFGSAKGYFVYDPDVVEATTSGTTAGAAATAAPSGATAGAAATAAPSGSTAGAATSSGTSGSTTGAATTSGTSGSNASGTNASNASNASGTTGGTSGSEEPDAAVSRAFTQSTSLACAILTFMIGLRKV